MKYSIQTAVRGLKTNKTRSALTILGIVIGITAIIMVMSLGRGAQNLILGEIKGLGATLIEVLPGRQPKGPTDFLSVFGDSLKQSDFESLQKKSNVPHAKTVMPLVFGSKVASFETEIKQATIYGTGYQFPDLYNIDVPPENGRAFSEEEVKAFADVAVIGSKIKEDLFINDENVVGKKIRISGKNFKVIGVLEKKGSGIVSFDDVILIPYTTAQAYIFGIKHFNHIVVDADSEEAVAETEDDIIRTIRANHNITDPEKDDFYLNTQAEAIKNVSTITNTLTWFLAAVAAISLVVGGVGIMNIMLVSVTERTREIGLRKAVGATNKDIMNQFLFEAIILTMLGGIIGLILGASLSFLVAFGISKALAVDWGFTLPISSVLLGVGMSGFVGLVFGLYPAKQASQKSPIEALRYE